MRESLEARETTAEYVSGPAVQTRRSVWIGLYR